jgi:hypothetical protein
LEVISDGEIRPAEIFVIASSLIRRTNGICQIITSQRGKGGNCILSIPEQVRTGQSLRSSNFVHHVSPDGQIVHPQFGVLADLLDPIVIVALNHPRDFAASL